MFMGLHDLEIAWPALSRIGKLIEPRAAIGAFLFSKKGEACVARVIRFDTVGLSAHLCSTSYECDMRQSNFK